MDLPDFVLKSPIMEDDDPSSLMRNLTKHLQLKVFISWILIEKDVWDIREKHPNTIEQAIIPAAIYYECWIINEAI